jgi:hypothetical protein
MEGKIFAILKTQVPVLVTKSTLYFSPRVLAFLTAQGPGRYGGIEFIPGSKFCVTMSTTSVRIPR